MQTANIMVDLGGDNGNQVPKYKATAAEIAVLISIHGESAVHDIEPLGDEEFVDIDGEQVRWTNRAELTRLRRIYSTAKDGEDRLIIDNLFPGSAAQVFETIDELGLPEEFFKPTARAAAPDPLDHDGDGKKGGAKPRKKAKAEAAPVDKDEVEAAEGIAPGDDPDVDGDETAITPPPSPEPKPDELFK